MTANTAGRGGAISNFRGSCTLTNCDFIGNGTSGFGTGVYNDRVSEAFAGQVPVITGCTFIDNVTNGSTGGGAGIMNTRSHPLIEDCVFIGNRAGPNSSSLAAGGGIQNSVSDAIVINCAFIGNTASSSGGAVSSAGGSPSFIDCLFSGNRTEATFSNRTGGGMRLASGSALILNCTFSNNSATSDGGGLWISGDDHPTVSNCIFWNNSDIDGIDESAQIFISGANPNLSYLCVQGLTGGLPGIGHIGLDPQFVDADGSDNIIGTEDDDLRLRPGSPCIDAADNLSVPAEVTTDLDGNPRFVDDPDTTDTGNGSPPIVDMGPYEFDQPPTFLLGDMNCDGVLDGRDIGPFVLAVLDPPAYAATYPGCNINRADIDGNALINVDDVPPFIDLLIDFVPEFPFAATFTTYPNGEDGTDEHPFRTSNFFSDFPGSWFVVWVPVEFSSNIEIVTVKMVVGQGGFDPTPPDPFEVNLRIVDDRAAAEDFDPEGENGPNYAGHEVFSMSLDNPIAEDFVPFGSTAGGANYEYAIDTPSVILPPGTYWFSIVWHDVFLSNGEYGPIVVEDDIPVEELPAFQVFSAGATDFGRAAITVHYNTDVAPETCSCPGDADEDGDVDGDDIQRWIDIFINGPAPGFEACVVDMDAGATIDPTDVALLVSCLLDPNCSVCALD